MIRALALLPLLTACATTTPPGDVVQRRLGVVSVTEFAPLSAPVVCVYAEGKRGGGLWCGSGEASKSGNEN